MQNDAKDAGQETTASGLLPSAPTSLESGLVWEDSEAWTERIEG